MSQHKAHLWCLIDVRTKKTVEGLLFDEARAVISAQETDSLVHWWAWRDDWADWRRVTEFEGLTEMIYRQLDVAPPPAPNTQVSRVDTLVRAASGVGRNGPQGLAPVVQEMTEETDLSEMSLIAPSVDNVGTAIPEQTGTFGTPNTDTGFTVRSKRRFKKRYDIQIEIDGKIFKSHSRDISVGGINLEEPLPDWVQGHFKVRIGKPNSKKQIELKCTLIRQQNSEDRHRIKILPLQNVEDEKKLEVWIAA